MKCSALRMRVSMLGTMIGRIRRHPVSALMSINPVRIDTLNLASVAALAGVFPNTSTGGKTVIRCQWKAECAIPTILGTSIAA
jgi:hypothetical protein